MRLWRAFVCTRTGAGIGPGLVGAAALLLCPHAASAAETNAGFVSLYGALRANLGGASYGFGKLRVWLSFFNGDGGAPVYHGAGGSLSAQYSVSANARAALGYAHVRDYTTPDGSADQFSAAFEYDVSRTLQLYFSAAYLANHDDSSFTLRGVNVTGLPAAYPGAPVAGVQFGVLQRF
jgi:predicted porin